MSLGWAIARLAALWQTLRPRQLEGFRLDGERLAVATPDAFTKDPVAILRLFHVAQENDLDVHPATLRLITQNIRLVDRLRNDPEAESPVAGGRGACRRAAAR